MGVNVYNRVMDEGHDLLPTLVTPTPLVPRALFKRGVSTELIASWLGRYTNARSRQTYADTMRRVSRLLGIEEPVDVAWATMTQDHVSRIRLGLSQGYAPATFKMTWTVLASLWDHARRVGLLDRDRFERLIDQPRFSGSRVSVGRALTFNEIDALVRVAKTPGIAAARAGAIFALGYGAGLRCFEIASVTPGQIVRERGTSSIRVIGKRNKERKVALISGAVELVDRWLSVRGAAAGPIVCALSTRGGHVLPMKPMSNAAIAHVITRHCEAAGVARITPHDLRRTFATHLLDAHVDIFVVQHLMGHDDPKTTILYDKNPERGKVEAVAKLRGLDGVLESPKL